MASTACAYKAFVCAIAMFVQAVRDKVVSNLATSLDKAATELKKEGHSEGLPDATAVARSVEQALQKHFGTTLL